MIAFISGMLAHTHNNSCIVLTRGGVGYEIALPLHTFSALPEIGQTVEFFTSLAVREDAQELFGFATFEERQTFRILTGISKVGARTALAILSIYRPDELAAIVRDANAGALTKISGIGKKTAQHILLELQYKLAAKKARPGPREAMPSSVCADTLAALANLGYGEDECGRIVRDIVKAQPDLDTGSAIRLALKALAKGKL